jgi:hypothetical protein
MAMTPSGWNCRSDAEALGGVPGPSTCVSSLEVRNVEVKISAPSRVARHGSVAPAANPHGARGARTLDWPSRKS